MGQRLNLEIAASGTTLANAYYHWSAYTESAAQITEEAIQAYFSIGEPKEYSKRLHLAVKMLESTGAGITADEQRRINSDTSIKYRDIDFRLCLNRDSGLISVTEQGIEETRNYEEGRVTIDLDSKSVDFGVFWYCSEEEFKREFDEDEDEGGDEGETRLNAIPIVDIDFPFDFIDFDKFGRFVELIDSYPRGFRTPDGVVYQWIQ